MANIFSVVALLILFREALEASIIILLMLQLCDRLKLQPMKKIDTLKLTDAYVTLGRIALSQACSNPVLQSSTEQWGLDFALGSAAVH